MKAIGLDIGTTTICATVIDYDTGLTFKTFTKKNDSALPDKTSVKRLQDTRKIRSICLSVLNEIFNEFPDIKSIGISGQMHGVLYVGNGEAKSDLITWQDGRGNLMSADSVTYAQKLSDATGIPAASGYGLVTLLHDAENGFVPPDADSICTIGDYIAMVLCGNKSPLLHASNAASLGGYDILSGRFHAGLPVEIDRRLLPEIVSGEIIIGKYREASVCCAVGDNQCSVFGSLDRDASVLVNIGTGGQISAVSGSPVNYRNNGLECRPYVGGKYLSVGASLCGGYAYNILNDFFTKTSQMLGSKPPENLYEIMNAYAQQAMDNQAKPEIDTRFQGTRVDPSIRGSINNIGADNFTPGALCLGVLEGICNELWELSKLITPPIDKNKYLTASGGGIRNNKLMQQILSNTFGMRLTIPTITEEAAYGAALLSATTDGI